MQSEPKTPDIDPRDVGIAPETEPPGRIYKQVVREVLARIDQRLADIEKHTVIDPSGGQPGAAQRAPTARRSKRGLIAVLVVVGVIGLAFAGMRFDGDTARATVARWTPRFIANVLSTQDNQDATPGTSPVTVGTAADGRTSSDARSAADGPAASPDRTTPDLDGQNAASSSPPDVATSIERMSRDIVTLTQGIEQLKVNQEQMSKDNAKASEEFKASEDQLIRMLLRVSEQQSPQSRSVAATPSRTKPAQAQARTAASPARGTVARPRQAPPGLFSRRPT
jgi:hypothetical protein